jgi:hypothetical protein
MNDDPIAMLYYTDKKLLQDFDKFLKYRYGIIVLNEQLLEWAIEDARDLGYTFYIEWL